MAKMKEKLRKERYKKKITEKKVIINKKTLFISALELEIPYKLFLGSSKDIEDALHL